jgi:hypothetical protein
MREMMLRFLRAEIQRMEREATHLREGKYRLLRTEAGAQQDVTTEWLPEVQQRIDRFEEMIAALEARL